MQLLDTDLTQNEVKTDSEVGSLFLKPNKLGATVEKEASTTFALCVEEPLRYFSVWAVPPGTAADDYMSARTFQFTRRKYKAMPAFPSTDARRPRERSAKQSPKRGQKRNHRAE